MNRWAKSYSIVDHALLHGGYLSHLSHRALALYLFYVVVGDAQGKNFYGVETVLKILRLDHGSFVVAQKELIDAGLIDYRKPNVWLKNLSFHDGSIKDCHNKGDSNKGSRTPPPANRQQNWHSMQEVLEGLLRSKR